MIDEIIKSMRDEPYNWSFNHNGALTLDHIKNGLSIWMDNIPLFCISIYRPHPAPLTFWQKYRIYKEAKKLQKNKINLLFETRS